MKHDEWKQTRCPMWDIPCTECLKKPCLDDPEYEDDTEYLVVVDCEECLYNTDTICCDGPLGVREGECGVPSYEFYERYGIARPRR